MTFAAHVKGGTGAGRKRPLLPAYTIPWACECPKTNPGYLRRCIDCGERRP